MARHAHSWLRVFLRVRIAFFVSLGELRLKIRLVFSQHGAHVDMLLVPALPLFAL